MIIVEGYKMLLRLFILINSELGLGIININLIFILLGNNDWPDVADWNVGTDIN